MANDRPTLNLGNTTKNCLVRKHFVCEGNVNVTNDSTYNVNIGDTVQDVTAKNITLRNTRTYSISSNTNVTTATSTCNTPIMIDRRGAVCAGYTTIGNTNQNLIARNVHNETTVILNSDVHSIPNTILFQVEEPETNFTGRSIELHQLQQFFTGITKICVVCGMGGVGKTQLVREFIKQNKSLYENVIWIHSDDVKSIEQSFRKLSKDELRLQTLDADGGHKEPRSVITKVLTTLYEKKTLIVYDNVDNVDSTNYVKTILAMASPQDAVKPHVLITSRHQEWPSPVKMFSLKVWDESESLEYISKILNDCPSDSEDDKKSLAKTLRYFPLALRQSTAYIKVQRRRNSTYKISLFIGKFSRKTREMLNDKSFKKDSISGYDKTTYTTWRITMDEIEKDESNGALAIRILKIIAYCEADCIERKIFYYVSNRNDDENEEFEDWIERVDSAVDLLMNYCMVDSVVEQKKLSVHRLVQEVTKLLLEESSKVEKTLRDALQLLTNFVAEERKRDYWFVIGLHTMSIFHSVLSNSVKEILIKDFSSLPVTILRVIVVVTKAPELYSAIQFGDKIVDPWTKVLGPSNRHVLKIRYYVALSTIDKHLAKQALGMFLDIYEKQKVHLSDADSDTIETQCQIARSYLELGKYDEAANWFKEYLTEKQKNCHVDIFGDVIKIADEYRYFETTYLALRLYQIIFVVQKKLLGEGHSDTLRTMHEIAHAHRNEGNYELAFNWYKDSFEIMCRDKRDKRDIFGKFLAIAKNCIGNYLALRLYQFIFKEQIDLLGEDHSDTYKTLFLLAGEHSRLKNNNSAVQLYKIVFEKQKKELVKVVSDNVEFMCRIASEYSHLRNYDLALEWYRNALEIRMIDTARENFTSIFEKMLAKVSLERWCKNYDLALRLYKNIFEKQKAVLGENHHETLKTMCQIARTHFDLRKIDQAFDWYQNVLDIQNICLGEGHCDTLNTKCAIARTYSELKDDQEALNIYENVLEKQKALLGENHNNTIKTLCMIARTRSKLTSNHAALELYRNVLDKLMERKPFMDVGDWLIINNEASFFFDNGNYDLAVRLYEINLEKQNDLLGADHIVTHFTSTKMSHAQSKLTEKSPDLLQLYQDTLEKQKKCLGEGHVDTLETMCHIADAHSELQNHDLALQWYLYVLNKQQEFLSERHTKTRDTMFKLIRTHGKLQNYDEALKIYRSALEMQTRRFDGYIWMEFYSAASVQFEDENYGLALQFYELMLEKQTALLDIDHSKTLKTMCQIARSQSKLQKYDEALYIYQNSFERRKKCLGEFHPDTLETMSQLAHLNKDLGNYTDAQQLYRHLYDTLNYLKGNEHPNTITAFQLGELGEHEVSESYLPNSLREELQITLQHKKLQEWSECEALPSHEVGFKNKKIKLEDGSCHSIKSL